eukprot:12993268-Heterocapsa_arctica.AAC.1
MTPASSRHSSVNPTSSRSRHPHEQDGPHYQGPSGWEPESMEALHLFLLRFGDGDRRCVPRHNIYAN